MGCEMEAPQFNIPARFPQPAATAELMASWFKYLLFTRRLLPEPLDGLEAKLRRGPPELQGIEKRRCLHSTAPAKPTHQIVAGNKGNIDSATRPFSPSAKYWKGCVKSCLAISGLTRLPSCLAVVSDAPARCVCVLEPTCSIKLFWTGVRVATSGQSGKSVHRVARTCRCGGSGSCIYAVAYVSMQRRVGLRCTNSRSNVCIAQSSSGIAT